MTFVSFVVPEILKEIEEKFGKPKDLDEAESSKKVEKGHKKICRRIKSSMSFLDQKSFNKDPTSSEISL